MYTVNFCFKCKNTGVVPSAITTVKECCGCKIGGMHYELVKPKPELIGDKQNGTRNK